MKTTTTTTAVAALAALAFAGCTPDAIPPNAIPSPEVAAALDMADELDIEWGAAPWSPPGWPLKVGDKISQETLDDLQERFSGGWLNGIATNWVDGLPFGAWIMGGNRRDVESETPYIYHGHFPRKVSLIFKPVMSDFLPSHLRGRNVDHLFRGADWSLGTPEGLRKRWHEPWIGMYGDGGKGGGP